jgi:hypothetical protein
LWDQAFYHYTRAVCPRDCPCNEFYGKEGESLEQGDVLAANALSSLIDVENDMGGNVEIDVDSEDGVVVEVLECDANDEEKSNPNVKVRKEAKKWLDRNIEKEKDFITKMQPLFQEAKRTASDVLFGLNTCLSECINSRRLVFCRKDRFYYSSYEARSLISAVLENVGKTDLFKRLFQHFGIELDAEDENCIAELELQDKKGGKHSKRKKSLEFTTRQAVLSKRRIAVNIEATEASQARRQERGYLKYEDKKMGGNASFLRKRGKQSQESLKAKFDDGIVGVNECPKCGMYYTNTHNTCRKNRGGSAGRKKSVKRPRGGNSQVALDKGSSGDKGPDYVPERVSKRIKKSTRKAKESEIIDVVSEEGSEWEDPAAFDDGPIDYSKPNPFRPGGGKIKGG